MISTTIAIDFGTSRTKVAYVNPNTRQVELLYLGEDNRPFIPSTSAASASSEIVFGEWAIQMMESGEAVSYTDAIKRKFEPLIVGDEYVEQAKLQTEFFKLIRERVAGHPGFSIPPLSVYATYPLKFDLDSELEISKSEKHDDFRKNFEAAGFDQIELIDEPTAAATMFRALAADSTLPNDIIVVDIGGGTTDWCYLHRTHQTRPYGRHGFKAGTCDIGGCNIDNALEDIVKDRTNEELDYAYVRRQVRDCKECYCSPYTSWEPIKLRPDSSADSIELTDEDIRAAINEAFIEPVSEKLLSYADGVSKKVKRKPTFILTGGGAKLIGLKEALKSGGDVVQSPQYEYATVLGAMYYALGKDQKTDTEKNRIAGNTYTYEKQNDPITALTFSVNGELLAGASGKSVTLWELTDQNFKSVRTVLEHEDPVTSVSFSADDTCIATVTTAKTSTINLWDVETGKNIRKFEPQLAPIRCITFSPDGVHIASGDAENEVKLWNVRTGKSKETFVGKNGKHRHKGYVNSVAFSHGGTLLASGGQDCTVKLWYVGREKKPLTTNEQNLPDSLRFPVIFVSFFWTEDPDSDPAVMTLEADGKIKMLMPSMNNSLMKDMMLHYLWWGHFQIRNLKLMSFYWLVNWLGNTKDVGCTNGSLTLQGWDHRLVENGTLKIDDEIEFQYTDSVSCAAFRITLCSDERIAFGSKEGTVKIWNEGSDLLTLLYPETSLLK